MSRKVRSIYQSTLAGQMTPYGLRMIKPMYAYLRRFIRRELAKGTNGMELELSLLHAVHFECVFGRLLSDFPDEGKVLPKTRRRKQ